MRDEESGPTNISSPSHVMDGDIHPSRKSVAGKPMTNQHGVLKSRDITLPTKVPIVKAMVFPIVTYRRESWTVKKTEHQRTDASNCGAGEDSREFLGLKGDQTSPS